MKKIVTLFLAMCLLLAAVPALADKELTLDSMTDTMLVSLTVTADLDSFTVVIPSAVAIDPVTQHGSATITLQAGWKLVASNKLRVMISSAENGIRSVSSKSYNTMNVSGYYAFDLKNAEGIKVAYDISNKQNTASSYSSIDRGSTYLKLIEVSKPSDATKETTAQKAYLHFDVLKMPGDGVYTDTITFSVVLE